MQKVFGSFKDNHGNVFEFKRRIFRGLTKDGYSNFIKFKNDNTLEESINRGFLINSWEVDLSKETDSFEGLYSNFIEHKKIKFISFPYEWSFEQLKDASLLHLNFQIFLLNKGYVLKDASAFNIQFENNKPIFIDLTSVVPYEKGQVWTGHNQFCREFLNPLLLSSKKNIPFNNYYSGSLNGIPTEELNNIFSLFDKLSLNVFLHIFLKSFFQKKSYNLDKINKINKKTISKNSYYNILISLKKWIEKLEIKKKNFFSLWSDYSKNNTYSNEQEKQKKDIIEKYFKSNKSNNCLDIGCNTGEYSFLALENGVEKVVGIDSDYIALNNAYKNSKIKKLNFLPLYIDLLNPSPKKGWMLNERSSFNDRFEFDSQIALAVVHHICIGGNIDLKNAVKFLLSLSPKGLIEFVPKNDYTVQKMLGLRDDIFDDYNEENFVRYLRAERKIVKIHYIKGSDRKIFEFDLIN